MIKRTATITWVNYHNFGTYLQAYALQRYIMKLGYENTILDDLSMMINKKSWKYELKKTLICLFRADHREYEKSKCKINGLFDKFKHTYLFIDYDVSNLFVLDSRYDTFICGSDQIWNPFLLADSNVDFYYASFSDKKKIAYAPSIGVSEMPQQYKEKFKKLACAFDSLSAREWQGVDVLSELTGKIVTRVVDPTLLLSVDKWNELLNTKHLSDEKYVLAYFLTPNAAYMDIVKKYANKHGLILKMFFTDKSYSNSKCQLISAGPIEFLYYVKHADCLFTDSFHGSIFASIFHTQFFTFKRFRPNATSQNSRVENLLEMMGISERLLDEQTINNVYKLSDIDFKEVDANLAPHIKRSEQYLKKALE